MRKIIILLILLILIIPIKVKAQIYYTDYKPYLLNLDEKIEVNDLIKEEIKETYHYYKNIKVNMEYHPFNLTLLDKPYKDINDVILKERHASVSKMQNYGGARIFETDNILVKELRYDNIEIFPPTKLYKRDKTVIDYSLVDNKIVLNQEVYLHDLLIFFDATDVNRIIIIVNENKSFHTGAITNINPYFEVSFTSTAGMKEFLSSIGVYSSHQYSTFFYYVKYTYNCLYYNLEKVEATSDVLIENYFKKTTKYNYYKRDYINLNDYLIISKEQNNLSGIISSSSIPTADIQLSSNYDINKNGVYKLNINYENIDLNRPVIVLNEVKVESNICKEPEIIQEQIIKYIEVPKEVVKYVEKKVDCKPKEIIKYVEIPKEVVKTIPKVIYKTKEVPKYITKEKEVLKPCPEPKEIYKNTKTKKQISGVILIPFISIIIFVFLTIRKKIKL